MVFSGRRERKNKSFIEDKPPNHNQYVSPHRKRTYRCVLSMTWWMRDFGWTEALHVLFEGRGCVLCTWHPFFYIFFQMLNYPLAGLIITKINYCENTKNHLETNFNFLVCVYFFLSSQISNCFLSDLIIMKKPTWKYVKNPLFISLFPRIF